MPLTPFVHKSSPCATLQDLFLQHEYKWDEILKYLSLSDMGNLRAVSHAFQCNQAILSRMDRAALEYLRQEDLPGISHANLLQFRFHPLTKKLVEDGHLAMACMASLQHARQPGTGHATVTPIPLPLGGTDFVGRFQARDGRMLVCEDGGAGHFTAKYILDTGHADPVMMPDGFSLIGPAATSVSCMIHCTRHFLTPMPDRWLLEHGESGRLFYFSADEGPSLWFPRSSQGRLCATAISHSGRFIALVDSVAAEPGGKCLRCYDHVQCYDRELDGLFIDTQISDPDLNQVSVADDGWLYASSQTRGYVIGENQQISFVSHAHDDVDEYQPIFRLSPDGRFLIRTCFSPSYRGCEVLLQDRKRGGEIILLRMAPPRDNGWGMQPVSIAFSALNRLAAVAYFDGVVQVFDLYGGDTVEARIVAQSELPQRPLSALLHTRFDGFNRVQTIFRERVCSDMDLSVHTLYLGPA